MQMRRRALWESCRRRPTHRCAQRPYQQERPPPVHSIFRRSGQASITIPTSWPHFLAPLPGPTSWPHFLAPLPGTAGQRTPTLLCFALPCLALAPPLRYPSGPMKLYRAFATVGGLTMISRVFGFLRDILIAATLGSGAVADAFFVAFRFPNLFRRLFGEGAFNSAFVPLFAKRIDAEGREAARRFAEEALAGLVFVLLLITAIAEIAMPFLMLGLAPGFNATPEKFDLAVLLTRITMPYLLCMSVVALLSGVLNSVGKFVEGAAVSIVLNLTMMGATGVAIALGLTNEPLAGVIQAWGVFAAGILQLLLLLDGARRNGLTLRLRRPRMTEGVRRLISLGIPGVVSGGVTQINIVIGTVIASLQAGAVSHLYYADRVYELPLAIVGVAIGVVLLPDVARQLRAGNQAAV